MVRGMRCCPGSLFRQQKHLPFLLIAFCSVVRMQAEDLTTASGHTFHNVQVTSRSTTTLVIQSDEGQAVVPVADLKPADKEKFSKDLTKAIELPALTVIRERKPDQIRESRISPTKSFAGRLRRRRTRPKIRRSIRSTSRTNSHLGLGLESVAPISGATARRVHPI